MQFIKSFFQLVRWQNLIFVFLTQLLFHCCIYQPIYGDGFQPEQLASILWIALASVCITAGGYIINDYYDINIDLKNKPDKVIVSKLISRRFALLLHFLLNFIGIVSTIMAVQIKTQWYLVLANIAVVILLWIYSSNFKRNLLIGNIVVALLTAWTILIVFFTKFSLIDAINGIAENQIKFFRIAILYAAFAFIITLIREAVKDAEDMDGDQKSGCKTMPIVWGINATKVYVCSWTLILISILGIVMVYSLQFRWWWFSIYILLILVLPLIQFLKRAIHANSKTEFTYLSKLNKQITLLGILSMILFYLYL